MGNQRHQPVDDAGEIDVEGLLEILELQGIARHRDVDAGIQHRQRHAAVLIFDRRQNAGHVFGIGHIAIENDDAPRIGGRILQLHQLLVAAGRDDDAKARVEQPQRHGAANAAAGPVTQATPWSGLAMKAWLMRFLPYRS